MPRPAFPQTISHGKFESPPIKIHAGRSARYCLLMRMAKSLVWLASLYKAERMRKRPLPLYTRIRPSQCEPDFLKAILHTRWQFFPRERLQELGQDRLCGTRRHLSKRGYAIKF